MIKHIYIHIPFCLEICTYCDFKRVRYDVEIANKYLVVLAKEIKNFSQVLQPTTIYLGGGTPSALNLEQLKKLFSIIYNHFDCSKIKEFTCEMNPDDINKGKLKLLKEQGVNRISIGVQTFNDSLLKTISRRHSVQQVIDNFWLTKKYFSNVSLDLIYNLPGQTMNDIEQDLDYIAQLKPTHLSWYSLIIKEKSKLKNHQIDVDVEANYMEKITKKLISLKYHHYEISNYSQKQQESLHNKGYWTSDNWIGFGVGAASFIGNKIIENKGDVLNYKAHSTTLSTTDLYEQVIMMGFRYYQGLDLKKALHNKAYQFYQIKIDKLIKEGELILQNNHIYLTKKNFMLLDNILLKII